jgi:hypothetical protein
VLLLSVDSQMSYAIFRFNKVKSVNAIIGSLEHNYRTQNTPNSDPNRVHLNEHSVKTFNECLGAIKSKLPEKRRKDAVLCLEHLITASPDWTGWGTDNEKQFFDNSIQFLEKKYGKNNIVAKTVHRDETTPHLVVYVVPIDEETNRLNAKKYVGGSKHELSKLQTDFAKNVEHLGLERGLKGSKAKHKKIKDFYSDLENVDNFKLTKIDTSSIDKHLSLVASKSKQKEQILETVDDMYNFYSTDFDNLHKKLKVIEDQKKQANASEKRALNEVKKLKDELVKSADYLQFLSVSTNEVREQVHKLMSETIKTNIKLFILRGFEIAKKTKDLIVDLNQKQIFDRDLSEFNKFDNNFNDFLILPSPKKALKLAEELAEKHATLYTKMDYDSYCEVVKNDRVIMNIMDKNYMHNDRNKVKQNEKEEFFTYQNSFNKFITRSLERLQAQTISPSRSHDFEPKNEQNNEIHLKI